MKLTLRELVVPIIAAGVLALTLQQTLAALRDSGSWQPQARTRRLVTDDPYSRVDLLFAQDRPAPSAEAMRNPFAFGGVRVAPAGSNGHTATRRPPTPPPPPKPTLTSIIWDNDPRATVRYDGRDFSVRVNSLFADFRVKNITANQVILDRNGETIVLALRSKGE